MACLNILNLTFYVANIVVTFVVGTQNITIFGKEGMTNKEVSDMYPTLLTPIGWAFSIWGLIFTLEGIWSIYQLLPSVRDSEIIQKGVSWWWILMNIFQIAWSFCFSFDAIIISTICMTGIFLSLLALTLSVRRYRTKDMTLIQYFLCVLPFGINFGWICCAFTVNLNICLLVLLGSNGHKPIIPTSSFEEMYADQTTLAVISVIILAIMSFYSGAILRPGCAPTSAVIAWASVAIAQNLEINPLSWVQDSCSILGEGLMNALYFLAALSVLFTLVGFITSFLFSIPPGKDDMNRRGSDNIQAPFLDDNIYAQTGSKY